MAAGNPSHLLASSSTRTFCLRFASRHCVEQPAKDLSNFFYSFFSSFMFMGPIILCGNRLHTLVMLG